MRCHERAPHSLKFLQRATQLPSHSFPKPLTWLFTAPQDPQEIRPRSQHPQAETWHSGHVLGGDWAQHSQAEWIMACVCSTPDICAFCHKTVSPRELAVEAMKRQYHAQCFTCRACRRQLAGQSFYQKDGRPLCEPCYQVTPRGSSPGARGQAGHLRDVILLQSWTSGRRSRCISQMRKLRLRKGEGLSRGVLASCGCRNKLPHTW